MFVVIDKTRPAKAQVEDDLKLKGQIAGQLALMRTIPINLTAEVGFIVTLPEYQRTHVTSNAIGLLLKYALNLPTDPVAPGLGFRRVDWRTHSWNTPSVTTARRLGFVDEGILRWFVTLPPGREGNEPREGQDNQRKGRHTAFLAMCWDVWEARGRATVEKQMCRRE
jgi:RimJ/RimL family protein N-acetyltransferase